MNKKRSARSASTINQPVIEEKLLPEIEMPPLDTMVLKVFSLRISDQDLRNFAIKVTFFDQLLLHAIIKPIGARDEDPAHSIANGTIAYDPSDYEKMCLFADSPLVAQIQPLRNINENRSGDFHLDQNNLTMSERTMDISCCNVDILPIFTDMKENQKICIKKRMEPMVLPSALKRKSWDTLPLLTMELTVERNPLNSVHHKVLKKANWMKLTLIAAYNMIIPFENDYVYTAASKIPSYAEDDTNVGLVIYSQGYKEPRRFDCTSFFPKWESLRGSGEIFTQGDQKFQCQLEDIQIEHKIDLPFYLNGAIPYRIWPKVTEQVPQGLDRGGSGKGYLEGFWGALCSAVGLYTAVWGSFHRTLMLKGDKWLWRHLRNHKWPLEVHIYGENGGYSFMSFLNLFKLLYPGEQTIRLAVPLHWVNAEAMMMECGCDLLLTPNDRPPSINEKPGSPPLTGPRTSKISKLPESYVTSVSTLTNGPYKTTGADENDAFVVVEIELGRPLKPIIKPPRILKEDIGAMLTKMELEAPRKRICTGRGQLERDWQKTVRSAANSLRKVPYYGATEFCTFNRQLSETRTRVEITTSCWQDAAVFVNNHFVLQQYQQSDEVFEELVMMSHACLMKSASKTLIHSDHLTVEVEPAVRAARHARQMQDTHHAIEIYLRLVVDKPRNADYWRELSTCLKDIDRDWARVCLDKAIFINPRHPLTLLSKGAMLFEEDPSIAEPFFIALLTLHPTWTTAWAITSVYFYERELFHLATVTMTIAEKWRNLQCSEDVWFQRMWEKELGDWWDYTPLLPGMSLYFDAADLLLRLRAVPLAEVCIARVLSVTGESAQYYHLVGLCCRLREDYEEALCHLRVGLEKFGEIGYLRSLEAEVQHRLGNFEEASESFQKAGISLDSFSAMMSLSSGDNQHARATLLDLVRRQPSAYAWTALAEDWLANPPTATKTSTVRMNIDARDLDEGTKTTGIARQYMKANASAIACAIQALKIDRQAGRAWAILSKLVMPRAKRLYCLHMAQISGWKVPKEDIDIAKEPSQLSYCHGVGTALRECHCGMCDKTRV